MTVLMLAVLCHAQNTAITDDDSYTADPSAMLDVKSDDKGILIPRIDFNNKPADPASGLMIYVTANGPEGNNCYYYYNGAAWKRIETTVTAGDGIVIEDNEVSVQTYSVGDYAFGGVVFYVEPCGTRGLVCAINDLAGGAGVTWRSGDTYYETKATGKGIYAGKMNTSIIVAVHSAKDDLNNCAAYVCASYNSGEYGDWYLPSREELALLYQNKDVINTTAIANGGSAFAEDDYWSSTETNHQYACGYDFQWNVQFDGGPKLGANKVRAIRAF